MLENFLIIMSQPLLNLSLGVGSGLLTNFFQKLIDNDKKKIQIYLEAIIKKLPQKYQKEFKKLNDHRKSLFKASILPLVINHHQKDNLDFLKRLLISSLPSEFDNGVDFIDKFISFTIQYFQQECDPYLRAIIDKVGVEIENVSNKIDLQNGKINLLLSKIEKLATVDEIINLLKKNEKNKGILIPPKSEQKLVERDELLNDLKKSIFEKNNQTYFSLYGMIGIGKTALALALVYDPEVQAHFQGGILWAGLGPKPNVIKILGDWCIALGISQYEVVQKTTIKARKELLQCKLNYSIMFFIIDDVWSDKVLEYFRFGGNCVHLITTRLPQIAQRFAYNQAIKVKELSFKASLILLKELAPKVVEAELGKAKELINAVGRLPLALILIGNYLRMESYSEQPRRIQKALNLLQQTKERLIVSDPQTISEHHPSLSSNAILNLNAVIEISDKAVAELNKSAQFALYSFSVFPPKPNSFSEEAATEIAKKPPETLNILTNYGMVESIGNGRYMLHQIIADYAKLKLSNNEMLKDTIMKRFVHYWLEYTKKISSNINRFRMYEQLKPELINLETAINWLWEKIAVKDTIIHDKEAANLLCKLPGTLSHFLWFKGHGDMRVQLNKKVYEVAYAIKNWKDAFWCAFNIAYIYYERGAKFEVEYWNNRCMKVWKFERGKREESTLNWIWGILEKEKGNYKEAKAYLINAFELEKKYGKPQHLIARLASLGDLAQKLGKFDEAERYYKQGIKLAKKRNFIEQQAYMSDYWGKLELAREHWTKARKWFKETYRLAKYIGRDALIARAQYGRAFAWEREGRPDIALPMAKEALRIFEYLKHKNFNETLTLIKRLS